MDWTKASAGSPRGELAAVDGKRIRRGFEHAWDHSTATRLASAFAARNRTALGQRAVDCEESEIVAIPKLPELPDPTGATVAVDATGRQTNIAGQIVKNGGDYVPAARDDRPALHGRIERNVNDPLLEKFAGVRHGRRQTVDGDHGRVEARDVWVTDEPGWLGDEEDRWPGLKSVAGVEPKREAPAKGVGVGRRYYISSRGGADAAAMGERVRGHWSVEDDLHWALDVSFDGDKARRREGHAAENFSRVRRIALNLLQRDKTRERGVKGKRLDAAWDHDYLLKLLTG